MTANIKAKTIELKEETTKLKEELQDHEEEILKGFEHLANMKEHEQMAEWKMKVLDDFEQQMEAREKQTCWFTSTAHLGKNLMVDEDMCCKEFRQKVLGFFENPRFEICVLLLVLTDLVMVILEAVIDSAFEFPHHGSHGDDHGTHGGGHSTHGEEHGGGHSTHGEEHSEGHSSHGEEHGEGSGHGAGETEHDHGGAHDTTHADGGGHGRRLRIVIRTAARPVVRRWVQEGSRFLSGAGGEGSCDIDHAYTVADTCRTISIVILFVFATEIIAKCCCAPKAFLFHFGHVLDAIVVFGSIIFEFTLHHSAGGLLVFFRCWRFVRIAHALYEQTEYMMKSLETEEHLENALNKVHEYKQYTEARNLRSDWQTFKKETFTDLETSKESNPPETEAPQVTDSSKTKEDGPQVTDSSKTKEDGLLEEIRSLEERLQAAEEKPQAEHANVKKLQEVL